MNRFFCPMIALLCLAFSNAKSGAQDLLNDNILFSGASLNLRRVANDVGGIPASTELISMTTQPGSSSLFVTTQFGQVFEFADAGNGDGSYDVWFDYEAAVSVARGVDFANGYALEDPSGFQGGLRSVAFHPDFETNGKFYTSAMVDRPVGVNGQPGDFNYLGNDNAGFDGESLVAEWTFDFTLDAVDASSYRELFRVSMPVFDHPIKQIVFNNFAQPSDEDYGLLYIAHGDGSDQPATAGGGQNTDDALGKILRVNPLQSGTEPYTTPGNPFNNVSSTLDEIYSLGHRNPHHLSFAQSADDSIRLIVAETGRNNVEEVNLIQAGADYGWSDREGTFVHLSSGGYLNGVSALPDNDADNGYTYPSAQYDHDAAPGMGFVGSVIGGGFVIANDSDPALQGEYIFVDFGSFTGAVYHASLEDLVAAKTTLSAGELPSELTQAAISRLSLTLDDNGDGVVDATADNINSLFGTFRNDVRFGRGANGEMFITSKRTGDLYVVTNTLVSAPPAPLPGDFNGSGVVDCDDVDAYVGNIGAAATGGLAELDLVADGTVDAADVAFLVETLVETTNGQVGTFLGDVNCDGQVNVLGDAFVLVAGLGNSATSYTQGDLNLDGVVNVLGDAFVLVANLGSSND